MAAAAGTPDPTAHFHALVILADKHHRAGRAAEAAATYRQILALRSDIAEVYNNLGLMLKQLGQFDEAATNYERAIALKPTLFQAINNLGNLLRLQGKLDQAATCYRQAIALDGSVAELHNNLGKALNEVGQFDEAAAAYQQAIALRPDYAEAHYHSMELKKYRRGDADLAALEALAADSDRLPPHDMVYIHFALGKALDDIGEHDRAFEQWLAGNALRRQEIDYDEAACFRDMQAVAERFTPALLQRLARAGDPSPRPIFIVGMPRSGSTLVEQILASHPQVQAAGELANLDNLVRGAISAGGRQLPFGDWIDALTPASIGYLGESYLASLPPAEAGQTRLTDKAPSNFFYAGLIYLMLPGARIVHTVRDPVDTCVSCFTRNFVLGQKFSYDLPELGRYYCQYRALVNHWRAVLPADAMLDVEYEAVVDDLEAQARRLIDYCGLPWDDRCLSFHETKRRIATASKVQVRRPLYQSSVGRWHRYAAQLEPLLEVLKPLGNAHPLSGER